MNSTADYYRWMADKEAHGVSPIYEEWARGVSEDPEILDLIDALPQPKRQANLLFAAARSLGAPVGAWVEFRGWLLGNWDATATRVRERSTQTNEAARCATLLTAFDLIDGPIALIEVGASAGLCLYPALYSYEYESDDGTIDRVDPRTGPSALTIPCRLVGSTAAPRAVPDVRWRGGIDLNPLDLNDRAEFSWLETLIWPEHDTRRERLHLAAKIAANHPVEILRGDLIRHLPALIERVPAGLTVVVFHTAVLAYLPPEARRSFVTMVSALDCAWVSNESPSVFPEISAKAPATTDFGQSFVLALDGEPIALTSPHGSYIETLPQHASGQTLHRAPHEG